MYVLYRSFCSRGLSGSQRSCGRSQVLCLPRNLHFEVHEVRIKVHKVLRQPRNLRVEVHECCACHEIGAMLGLPRYLRFEVHKVLCLPRDSHFEVKPPIPCMSGKVDFGPPKHEVFLAPATKSHHVRKCARHQNEGAVATRARSSHPDFASSMTVL